MPKAPPFQKGNPGRPKGAKDKHPRVHVASIRAMLVELAERYAPEIRSGILRKLKAGDARHVELIAAYLDGRPVQRISVETPQAITFILHPGSPSPAGPEALPPP